MIFNAVIYCEADSASRLVAGLSVLDRLLVAVNRAGATDITVVSNTALPRLKRAIALAIPFKTVTQVPASTDPVLVLSTGALVQTGDLKRAMEQRGRLVKSDGTLLPVG